MTREDLAKPVFFKIICRRGFRQPTIMGSEVEVRVVLWNKNMGVAEAGVGWSLSVELGTTGRP